MGQTVTVNTTSQYSTNQNNNYTHDEKTYYQHMGMSTWIGPLISVQYNHQSENVHKEHNKSPETLSKAG